MSNCDCEMEMPEFWSSSQPKARKDHKCCECRGIIKPGEVYHYLSGKWDGELEVYKTCVDCTALKDSLSKVPNVCECISLSQLYEEIFESESLPHMKEYVAIKQKRGAKIHDWMLERISRIEALSHASDTPTPPQIL